MKRYLHRIQHPFTNNDCYIPVQTRLNTTAPGSLTPELPESPEGALFFAQILKLHIAYMRIYGV
jgi:hypothetical protein